MKKFNKEISKLAKHIREEIVTFTKAEFSDIPPTEVNFVIQTSLAELYGTFVVSIIKTYGQDEKLARDTMHQVLDQVFDLVCPDKTLATKH